MRTLSVFSALPFKALELQIIAATLIVALTVPNSLTLPSALAAEGKRSAQAKRSAKSSSIRANALPISAPLPVPPAAKPLSEEIIDSVIASVNGKPITLSDLRQRVGRELSAKTAADDPAARAALDQIIAERLIEEEASARKISVGESEVDSYLNEVARRNGLSRQEFEEALRNEGRSLGAYSRQVRFEILRSRLIGRTLQGGVSVSDEEVQRYLESHPELGATVQQLKLSQLSIRSAGRSEQELSALLTQVKQRLDQGYTFESVANEFGDGDSNQARILEVAEGDLNEEIKAALSGLREGGISEPVASGRGILFFKLEQRTTAASEEREQRESEVRELLKREKEARRMEEFFTTDLAKMYPVERKL